MIVCCKTETESSFPEGATGFDFMRVALGINMRRDKFPSIGLDYGYNGIDSDLQVAPL